MDMKQIYSQILMQHARQSDYKHDLDDADMKERGHNPSCGDDIELQLKMEDGRIKEAAFTGQGCAISQASTSMLCQLIQGETAQEARDQVEKFLAMIQGDLTDESQLEDLGDAIALQDISHMPQRVKCAVLAWRTLADMLDKEDQAS